MWQKLFEDSPDEVTKAHVRSAGGVDSKAVIRGLQIQPVSCERRDLSVNDLHAGTALGLRRQEVVQHEPRRREDRWVERAEHDDADMTDLRVDPHNLHFVSTPQGGKPFAHGAMSTPATGARVYGTSAPTTSPRIAGSTASDRAIELRRPGSLRREAGDDLREGPGRSDTLLAACVTASTRVYSVSAGFVVGVRAGGVPPYRTWSGGAGNAGLGGYSQGTPCGCRGIRGARCRVRSQLNSRPPDVGGLRPVSRGHRESGRPPRWLAMSPAAGSALGPSRLIARHGIRQNKVAGLSRTLAPAGPSRSWPKCPSV